MTDASARARANKRKGASFEIDKEKYWAEKGFKVQRLARRGKDDEGDLLLQVTDLLYVVFEQKNEKSISLSTYTDEALAEARRWEARNVHQIPAEALVLGMWDVKRRNRGLGDSYTGSSCDELAALFLHIQGR